MLLDEEVKRDGKKLQKITKKPKKRVASGSAADQNSYELAFEVFERPAVHHEPGEPRWNEETC